MTNNGMIHCPFIANKMLTEAKFFVGRKAEIKTVMGLMTNSQPTSVNILGNSRIGKSSLLYQISHTYENSLAVYDRQPTEFVVVYLSLADARCQGVNSFYQEIADKLLIRQSVLANVNLADPLRLKPLDTSVFNRAMESWKKASILPVICLDDFDYLLKNLEQFDDKFYDNLRYLINQNLLMLIVASKKSIKEYRRKYKLTSNFFDVTQQVKLDVFSDSESCDLVRLPHGCPALSETRQKTALAWGKNHPYLLQLAGLCLWEAHQQDYPESLAEEKFRALSKDIPKNSKKSKWVYLQIVKLGKFGQKIGDGVDDAGNFFKGMTIILMVLLVLLGMVKWKDFSGFFQNTVTDILKNADTKNEGK
jgi:uncharacterized protein